MERKEIHDRELLAHVIMEANFYLGSFQLISWLRRKDL